MDGDPRLRELLDGLEVSRSEIVELYRGRVQLHVAAYRRLSPQQLEDTAALLLAGADGVVGAGLDARRAPPADGSRAPVSGEKKYSRASGAFGVSRSMG